jgi:hypothetical protein
MNAPDQFFLHCILILIVCMQIHIFYDTLKAFQVLVIYVFSLVYSFKASYTFLHFYISSVHNTVMSVRKKVNERMNEWQS